MNIGGISRYRAVPETVWMSTWLLELAYTLLGETCWIVLAVLETVYIAEMDVLWMNIEVSSYLETVWMSDIDEY